MVDPVNVLRAMLRDRRDFSSMRLTDAERYALEKAIAALAPEASGANEGWRSALYGNNHAKLGPYIIGLSDDDLIVTEGRRLHAIISRRAPASGADCTCPSHAGSSEWPHCKRHHSAADLIVRDACEAERADPEDGESICILRDTLQEIAERHTNPAPPTSGVDWRGHYIEVTAMRYMDNGLHREAAMKAANREVASIEAMAGTMQTATPADESGSTNPAEIDRKLVGAADESGATWRGCEQLIDDPHNGLRNCQNKPQPGSTWCKRHQPEAPAAEPVATGDTPTFADVWTKLQPVERAIVTIYFTETFPSLQPSGAVEDAALPAEAKPIQSGGLIVGSGIAAHGDYAIPTEHGCRVVNAEMARGWNECRKAMQDAARRARGES